MRPKDLKRRELHGGIITPPPGGAWQFSLSLSLSLSALPMQLHDRVGGTVIESPYEKKNSILQIKVAIYDACDRLS
jgi:hypothetical protein